ncbi:rod shape-determining protein RodA [Virgibacillus pantothenticus]|uniref:Cell division protein n=1 Tax=Virgibacillus pantothenticus TaxID=1473 RepID=A0A0L0QJL0_VIRPA|nr:MULTISPECIES: FtsW/RodA/SpoVE family cell cycle protein [Virgibacillus]API91632.1 cell division protein [Virgibacillus sp. 6R]KNE18694.1 cell division protein [Virgibacillus pantothenticus]MBS7426840.1 rod shape-determining protein RodA [Virgibacillus sp. 19R1-5]MBU8568298.1 rod shape-determining protein RodA [Virgibacillus pantothenticus]MBU8602203.1 rod shape-determining protein RodA [Virgibacillus pantothenticus]
MSKKQSYFVQTDLISIFILLVCVSLLAIYNAQQLEQYEGKNFLLQQAVWFTVGVGIVAAIQYLDVEQIYKTSVYVYAFGLFVLLVLIISPESIAPTRNGAKSWFDLKVATIQPSEFTKITTIVYMAAIIHKHKEKFVIPTIKSDLKLLFKILAIVAAPVLLIMKQPDFGTSMVYLFIAGVIIILSGINWKIITTLIVSISSGLGAVLAFIVKFPDLAKDLVGKEQEYQIDRILTWFDPTQEASDASWHFDQAFMALGSGQLFGKGLGNQQVSFPEAQTDFIFSIIGESFGFVGSALVIFLYFIFLYKLVMIGLSIYKHSAFAAYTCFGYMSLMLIHVFQNIGMALGIMPVTGIPLLLVSYGGSSVMAAMLGFGVIYRIAVENSIQNDYLFK